MTKAKILFVSYYYHQQTLTATRNYYISKALAEAGYEVHIMGRSAADLVLPETVKMHPVSAWDYRRILMFFGVRNGVTSAIIRPGRWIRWGYELLLKYPFNKWLAEGGGFYFQKARRKGSGIIADYGITHLFSSYRPMADHFIAQDLKQKHPCLVWIGDFRDVLWMEKQNPHYQEKWIRSLIRDMDHLTAVTRGVAEFWAGIYGRKADTIYNGLPGNGAGVSPGESPSEKFVINYTGMIYTQLQDAGVLFEVLKDLCVSEDRFSDQLLIQYSGLHSTFWKSWMKQYGLFAWSSIHHQLPVNEALEKQTKAHINLVLTWATPEVKGIIHGKFNEYVMARKPILCLISGDCDGELEGIYHKLPNSLLAYNRDEDKTRIRQFILRHFRQWRQNGRVEEIPRDILDSYDWSKQIKVIEEFLILNS